MEKKELKAVANNNNNQTREYNSLERKFFDNADYTLYLLEEILKSAINQEEYCAYIYDATHPGKAGKYNMCYRIEKLLNKYENKWKTKKVLEDKNDKPSPIAPIAPVNHLK